MQLYCNILMLWKLALKKYSAKQFIRISSNVCFIMTTGKGRYWMEICKKQTLDLLLWRGRYRPAPFQHQPHPQIGVLLPQVDLPKTLWPIAQDQEGAFEDGKNDKKWAQVQTQNLEQLPLLDICEFLSHLSCNYNLSFFI